MFCKPHEGQPWEWVGLRFISRRAVRLNIRLSGIRRFFSRRAVIVYRAYSCISPHQFFQIFGRRNGGRLIRVIWVLKTEVFLFTAKWTIAVWVCCVSINSVRPLLVASVQAGNKYSGSFSKYPKIHNVQHVAFPSPLKTSRIVFKVPWKLFWTSLPLDQDSTLLLEECWSCLRILLSQKA